MRATGDPKPFDITSSDPVARIQKYIDSYTNDASYKGFEASLMRNIRIISVQHSPHDTGGSIATSIFSLTVADELCNPMHNMHGGAVALLADMATTMAAAPVAERGFWEFGGVSRNLSVTFIKPVLRGSVAKVECTMLSVTSRLSLIKCVVKDEKTGDLLAVAEHGKVALGPQRRKGDQAKI